MLTLYTPGLQQLLQQRDALEAQCLSFGEAMIPLLPFHVGDTIQYSHGVTFRIDRIKFELHCYQDPKTSRFVPGFRAQGTQTIGAMSGSTRRHAVFDLAGQRIVFGVQP